MWPLDPNHLSSCLLWKLFRFFWSFSDTPQVSQLYNSTLFTNFWYSQILVVLFPNLFPDCFILCKGNSCHFFSSLDVFPITKLWSQFYHISLFSFFFSWSSFYGRLFSLFFCLCFSLCFLVVDHLPNCCFHFFSCYFPFKSLCSSYELLDVIYVFFVKMLHEMWFYDLLDLLWLWHISFLIVMPKLDLLMFHVQSFCCFRHSGAIFGILYFCYEVLCSFFSGISNFLIQLFEYLFSWFS